MADAGLTPARLARTVGVAPKTVERWLSDPSRVPHQRTREQVADALGVDENVLWPQAVRSVVKTGSDREVVATYPYRNACPTSVWADLIDRADKRLIFAGYTSYFIWQEHPRMVERLRAKAEEGAAVRFLLGDPESPVTARREEEEGVPLTLTTRIRITLDSLDRMGRPDGLEARYSDAHIALSVFVFDDDMLVTPHIANLLGHESPMLHLRRLSDDGMFARFEQHVDALWEGGRPAW